MTCKTKDLVPRGEQTQCFLEWLYETVDDFAAIEAPGYFAPATQMLQVGDTIRVRANVDGEFAFEDYVVVRTQPIGGAPELRRYEEMRRKAANAPRSIRNLLLGHDRTTALRLGKRRSECVAHRPRNSWCPSTNRGEIVQCIAD